MIIANKNKGKSESQQYSYGQMLENRRTELPIKLRKVTVSNYQEMARSERKISDPDSVVDSHLCGPGSNPGQGMWWSSCSPANVSGFLRFPPTRLTT